MRRFLALSLSSLAVIAALPGAARAAEGADAGAWLAARAASGLGDFRAGAFWYDRALQGDPANQQLLDGAVLSSIGLGDFPAAADYARRLSPALQLRELEDRTAASADERRRRGVLDARPGGSSRTLRCGSRPRELLVMFASPAS